ncbi:coiled-coil domain-containing protein 152-like isoform X1 [Scophthalmus maximus]|uniref:coiled-coil domain-containing protein 152-like isoform X1 n=1 Tax=Scophthalmus maximus TaxID=52904 RepID=UPI0015E06AB6|nr:coiled-coil domain-containing protein 152-like isoform X1 [Scophthalmus maximus]
MLKSNCVNLDEFLDEFAQLEQTITEVNGKNNLLEVTLEEATRLLKFHQTKEKSLTDGTFANSVDRPVAERDVLLVTVNRLQQTLQEQCNLRVENERLKKDTMDLKRQNQRRAEDGEAEVRRLLRDMATEEDGHQRELEAVRQRCRREVELAHRDRFSQLEAKDAEVKELLEKKDLDLEEMEKRLRDQERERQSEILKLQMEFGTKLARVQSSAQWSQQQLQQQGSSLVPPSVFKRKLQLFQEEKNKEIAALRQRIKELEENQRTNDSRLKRRKV